jgi:uncharacterized protein (DUF924 family)
MSITLSAATKRQRAELPLFWPVISRCFLAVTAAVISLLLPIPKRRSATEFLAFCRGFAGGTAKHGNRAATTAYQATANSEILFDRAGCAHYDGPMPFAVDNAPLPARAEAFLDFWFGPPDHPERHHHKQIWFRSTPAFDAAVRAGFAADHDLAVAGALADWHEAPLGALAHVMLLDQVPRNIFRSTPRAFASDHLALAAANRALERGFDRAVPDAWRPFFYLPFEHSEDLADQRRGLDLLVALPPVPGRAGDGKMSRLHLEIIERFGRFPHRNAILGRESTPEELAFLIECEHRFGQPAPP